jgi:hypothetical protein
MRRLQGILLIVVKATALGAMPIFARLAYDSGANAVSLRHTHFVICDVADQE